MPAELVSIEGTDQRDDAKRSTRLDKLNKVRRDAREALERALMEEGIINPFAGNNGYTPIQKLLQQFEHACYDCEYHLEAQNTRLRKQLENVLANDAFADPEARLAVLTSVNRARGQRMHDSALYSDVEQELIACYRRMKADDRGLLRMMLRRRGVASAEQD